MILKRKVTYICKNGRYLVYIDGVGVKVFENEEDFHKAVNESDQHTRTPNK